VGSFPPVIWSESVRALVSGQREGFCPEPVCGEHGYAVGEGSGEQLFDGPPMRGENMRSVLHLLARDFDRIAVPEHGRYVKAAA